MKKTLKKAALTTAMLFALGTVPAMAANAASNPKFALNGVDAYAGEEAVVSFSCTGNPGITAWKVEFQYDHNALELIDYDAAGVFEGIVPSQNVSADPFVMSWSNDIQDVTTNGKIAELKFKVKENAAVGKYPIKITYDEDNVYSVVLDESGIETNVHFDVQNGYINVKEKTQHEHTYKLISEKEATCTANGEKVYQCTGCDETKTEVIKATGHNYTTQVIAPTCTKAGYTLHTCKNCGKEIKDDYVDATGHQYVDKIIKPTQTTQGYTRHTCSVCGHSYKDNYTDPIGTEVEVTGVTLNKTSATINEGDSLTLMATLEPSNATDKSITWTTSNSSVAAVKNGVVTAVSKGTATITAASSNGLKAVCKVTVVTSEPVLSADDTTISALSIPLGKTFIVRANASNGKAPYQYALYYSYNGGSWVAVQTYQDSSSLKFTPKKTGNYQLYVKVKDSLGKLAKKYYDVLVYYNSYNLINLSELSSSEVYVGEKVKITASAKGGTGYYQYAMYYRASGESNWRTISNYSADRCAYFKTSSKGTYEILAKVKDSGGNIVKKTLTLNVKETDTKLKNTSVLRNSTIYIGQAVRVDASAIGGTGYYLYNCNILKPGETEWTVVQSYVSDNEIVFTIPESGDYKLCVKVKDSNGTIAKKYYDISVKIEENFIQNNSTVSATSITLGKSVVMKGIGAGGSGYYEYNMGYRMSGEEEWTLIQDFGANNRVVFKPDKKGTYELCIKVKDIQGVSEKKFFDLTVK